MKGLKGQQKKELMNYNNNSKYFYAIKERFQMAQKKVTMPLKSNNTSNTLIGRNMSSEDTLLQMFLPIYSNGYRIRGYCERF